ncbi:O-antigen ligase family protein [Pseudomonas sp. 1176_21]|uniref:O-antigen ligase family protein n=1 Tax=Pseudomonas sp. 1176_21 TaxID=2604453 RepID=UPI0015A7F0AC
MMYASRWAQLWLAVGLLWFLAGIALAPSNKIYQQGLIAFLWLPTLVLGWSAREQVGRLWAQQRALCMSVLMLLGWGLVSLSWAVGEEPIREGKRLFYIILFLLAFPLLASAGTQRFLLLMQWGGIGLGLAAAISIVHFYGVLGRPWVVRLQGIGEISHPILGAYVVGAAIVWMLHWMPQQRWMQLLWTLSVVCLGAFVMLGQSRGAALALLLTVVAMPLWCRDRRSRVLAAGALIISVLGFLMVYRLIVLRGVSYRPEIFNSALQMIADHPWLGLGLGTQFKVVANGIAFDHSHNMFTHIGIELGVPGLLLWAAVWLLVLREGWRARDTLLGKGLIGLWLFCTLAMQFDAASLTGTPRAEWFISWLPVGLASVLVWARAQSAGCDKIDRST